MDLGASVNNYRSIKFVGVEQIIWMGQIKSMDHFFYACFFLVYILAIFFYPKISIINVI